MRVGSVAQALAGQADHLVGDVHAVDLAEVAAQRPHQAARAAADFERARRAPRQALQLRLPAPLTMSARGGEELLVILLAAAEGDVIIGVLAGALVPVGAHAL